ncbi:MAG: PH domain-containing protein [Oscillospiraceae bacterium]|nr:PH domain-containing protein [Oscillospiraceae bacterium]
MHRQHPIAVIGYTSRYFWLLIIPLIRGLVTIRPNMGSIRRWAEGAEWDILIVVIMLLAAVYSYLFLEYEIDSCGIRVKTGVCPMIRTDIIYERISMVSAEQNLLYRGMRLVKIRIETDAPVLRRKNSDITLVMPEDEFGRLTDRISDSFRKNGSRRVKTAYKVSFAETAMFAMLFSSAVSGAFLMVTFISGSATIIGEKLEASLLGIVDGVSEALAELIGNIIYGISPVGLKISIIIGVGFSVSFISNLLRLARFTTVRDGGSIRIDTGLITKRMYLINAIRINMVDMRQNLFMKMAGLTSVHISCTGYGKQKSELPVFIPICSSRRKDKRLLKIGKAMEDILPEFATGEHYISSDILYAGRLIWPPALWVCLQPVAALVLTVFFPEWYDLILFVMIIGEVPAVIMLITKTAAYLTNGVDIKKNCFCAKYNKWYEFHTISVPFERLAQIKITQTPFQRLNRSCDVHIFTASEYKMGQPVRALPAAEVQDLLKAAGNRR